MSGPTLAIHVNGDVIAVPDPSSVTDLLKFLKIPLRHVAVEQNRRIVPKAEYDQALLTEGDRFEIVTLVGGG